MVPGVWAKNYNHEKYNYKILILKKLTEMNQLIKLLCSNPSSDTVSPIIHSSGGGTAAAVSVTGTKLSAPPFLSWGRFKNNRAGAHKDTGQLGFPPVWVSPSWPINGLMPIKESLMGIRENLNPQLQFSTSAARAGMDGGAELHHIFTPLHLSLVNI